MKLKEFISPRAWVRIFYIYSFQRNRMELGDFDYEEITLKSSAKVEFRDIYVDKNGNRYLGEW